nr:hypothetical protein [Tanacetum cinerariifolium]
MARVLILCHPQIVVTMRLDEHVGFTLPILDKLLSKGLHAVKSIPPKCLLRFSWVFKGAFDKVIFTLDDILCWVSLLVLPLFLLITFCPRSSIESEPSPSWLNIDEENLKMGERNVKQYKRNICDGHYTTTVKVLSSSSVAPYNDATLEELKAKHPLKPTPPCNIFLLIAINSLHLLLYGVVVAIYDDASLTLMVKPGGGIHPIVVGTDWRRLVFKAWYMDDDTVIRDTLVVGEVLKEDPRSRFTSVFPSNITRPLHGVKLLGGPTSVNFDFSSELVMNKVAKSSVLMDTVAKLNDPSAQHSFDAALHSSLKRIITAYSLRFGDWQWRLSTLPFAFEGLRVYSSRDIYRDHVVSCTGIVGIKHRHNIMRDTLIDIYFWSRILVGKEVDIGFGGG